MLQILHVLYYFYFIGNRDIQSLKVRCENEEDGCEWVGELRSLEDHLNTCGYVRISCPNRCETFLTFLTINSKKDVILRKDLQKHLEEECPHRQHTCPHCEKTGEYEEITGFHRWICPKMKISCPNDNCNTEFLRQDLQNHLSICPYQKVACKYKDFGCEETPFRKDLTAHEGDDKAHLHMTMDTMVGIKKEVEKLKIENASLQAQILTNRVHLTPFLSINQTAVLVFKLPKFNTYSDFFSPPFFTHPLGYKMIIAVSCPAFLDTHISVWAHLMKGEYDNDLEFPFEGTITFELLNQLEDKHHHKDSYTYDGTEDGSKRITDKERADDECGIEDFIPYSELEFNAAKNCQYLKDDCLVFRIYAEVSSHKPWLQCTAHVDNEESSSEYEECSVTSSEPESI